MRPPVPGTATNCTANAGEPNYEHRLHLVFSGGWFSPCWLDLGLMLLLGLGSLGGNLLVTQSLSMAPASVVVSYQYTLILWGMLFGYLFFGEVIGPLPLVGAGIIVGAGLFIFLREQALKRS